MNHKYSSAPAKPTLIALLIVVSICNWLAWEYWDPTMIMNDGVGYLSTASNWLQGNGFSTNALIYLPHFEGRLPAWEVVWPIGYPVVIAIFSIFGASLESTALVVNLVAHALSAGMIFIILRRCRVSAMTSLLSAALFYFTAEPWHLTLELMSEPTFALFVLTTVAILPDADRFYFRRLLLCGLLMAACTTIRYSAVITTVSFSTGIGLYFLTQIPKSGLHAFFQRSLRLTFFAGLSLAGFIGLQLRIYYIAGSLERDTGTGEQHGVLTTISDFAEHSSILVGFRDGWLFSGDTDKWLFFLFVFLIATTTVVALYAAVSNRSQVVQPPTASKVSRHGENNDQYTSMIVFALLAHTLFYSGYLFYCRLTESPLPVSARYLYQVYPGILIVFCIIVDRALKKLQGRQLVQSALHSLLVSLSALYLIAQLNLFPVIEEYTRSGDDAAHLLELPLSSEAKLKDVVVQCVGKPDPSGDSQQAHSLWSNEGVKLHQSSGANTITYTSIYSNRPFDFANFQKDIETYNINLFVFFNNPQSQIGDYYLILTSIKHWLSEKGYAKLPLKENTVASGTTVEVYSGQLPCDKDASN